MLQTQLYYCTRTGSKFTLAFPSLKYSDAVPSSLFSFLLLELVVAFIAEVVIASMVLDSLVEHCDLLLLYQDI